jgi:hypothetical protein
MNEHFEIPFLKIIFKKKGRAENRPALKRQ